MCCTPTHKKKPRQSSKVDAQHAKAIADISEENPKRRMRGLQSLEKVGAEELFDWCVLHLEDESVDVVCNALRIMCRCDEGYIAPILQYAESKDKRIRAGALAALAKHALDDTERWFERGLKDPAACVRMEVARLYPRLIELSIKTFLTSHGTIQIQPSNASLKSGSEQEIITVISE